MEKFRLKIASLIAVFALCGCAGFEGSERTLDPSGPVRPTRENVPSLTSDCKAETNPCNAILNFTLSYQVAAADAVLISKGANGPSQPTDPVSIHARQMAIDGASLVKSYCESFFDSGGDNQKWLNVARDILAEGGALASGVLALASPSNSTAAAALALSTATASNSVDIYAKNFLFGSDNIASVRQGTMASLVQHESDYKIDKVSDTTVVWDFRKAKNFVEDEQEICTPARIRSDVLSAIQNGPPRKASSGSP